MFPCIAHHEPQLIIYALVLDNWLFWLVPFINPCKWFWFCQITSLPCCGVPQYCCFYLWFWSSQILDKINSLPLLWVIHHNFVASILDLGSAKYGITSLPLLWVIHHNFVASVHDLVSAKYWTMTTMTTSLPYCGLFTTILLLIPVQCLVLAK